MSELTDNQVQTIVQKPNVSKSTGAIIPEEELRLNKDKGGRPLNITYQENIPLYIDLAIDHFKNGGSLYTLMGHVFEHIEKKHGFKKAKEMTPSKDMYYAWSNPESPYFIKEFFDVVKRYSDLRDHFWTYKAVLAKGMDSRRYQLYMANNYGWKQRADVTTDDQKLEAPVVHRPVKHSILQGSEQDQIEGEVDDE